jgi:hypothetical protein
LKLWTSRLLLFVTGGRRQLAPFLNESPTDLDNVINMLMKSRRSKNAANCRRLDYMQLRMCNACAALVEATCVGISPLLDDQEARLVADARPRNPWLKDDHTGVKRSLDVKRSIGIRGFRVWPTPDKCQTGLMKSMSRGTCNYERQI